MYNYYNYVQNYLSTLIILFSNFYILNRFLQLMHSLNQFLYKI
jgi:hypothetical protein